MRRLTLLGLALTAVLALAAIPASAVTPEILPSAGAGGRTGTGKQEGTKVELIGPLAVECTEANGTGTQGPNDIASGLFHIEFKGCEAAAKKCTGLNELTAGVVLSLGTWHLSWDREEGGSFSLTVAVVSVAEPVHFSCGGALLGELKGELVCLALKPEESATTHSAHCIPKLNAGSEPEPKQKEEYCSEDPCTKWTKPLMLIATNHGTFKEMSELGLGNETTAEQTYLDRL